MQVCLNRYTICYLGRCWVFWFSCCAMLRPMPSCGVHPSVCLSAVWMPVTFVHSVETNKRIFKIFLPSGSFCRAMLCKRDLCYHAVSVCVCVCVCLSVTLVHSVKMNKHVCNFFSLSGSHTILVFFHSEPYGDIPTGTLLTGASNASGGRQKLRFWANIWLYCVLSLSTLRPARCHQHGSAGLWQVVTLIVCSKRRSLFIAGDDEMFLKEVSALRQRQQNGI